MAFLHLNLKAEYFYAIAAGEKREEYRLVTPYWRRRLEGRQFSGIVLKKGYPKRDSRHLARPWAGLTIKTTAHTLFGTEPVQVFANTGN